MANETRARILDMALLLFNSSGIEGTPVTLICEKLEISPGNLTYHFPRKHDIVLALEERFQNSVIELQKGLLDAIARGERSDTPEETILLLKQMVDLIWDHRFYIASYAVLGSVDLEIVGRFSALERRARAGLAVLIQHALDAGILKPFRHPNSIQQFSDNIWYLLWGRILFRLMTAMNGDPDRASVTRDCLIAVVGLIEPHVAFDFAIALAAETASY